MKKLILLLFLFQSMVFCQKNYQKNSHVDIKLKKTKKEYKIDYTFKDHFNKTHSLTMSFDRKQFDRDRDKFGVPTWMFDRYTYSVEDEKRIKQERAHIIKDGLYIRKSKKIVADKNAIVNYYRSYLKPVAEYLIELLKDQNKDNRLNRIEIAMKFVQDIPYGVPPKSYYIPSRGENIHISGVFPPIQILSEGYGDCDSKTFLFVCILSYMINPKDILFAQKSGVHTLSAVKYENKISEGIYYKYNGKKHYICETAGPGRVSFGGRSSLPKGYSLHPLIIE